MYIFLSLVLIILISLIILVSLVHIKVVFAFSSQVYTKLNLMVSWLYPVAKAIITNEGDRIIMSFYLFNKKVLTRNLKNKKGKKKFNFNLIRSLDFDYINVRTSYGFKDPAITGWFCAIINFVLGYFNVKDSYNNPDFSMSSSYINLNAETKINVLSSITNYLKSKPKIT